MNEFVQEMKERTEQCYETAREHLRVAAERRKKTYDIKVKTSEFVAGEWVWYYYPRRYQKKSPKWMKSYTGPYLITRIIPPVNCVLQRSLRAKPFVVHVDKLKKCYGITPKSWLTTPGVETNVESDDACSPEEVAEEAELSTPPVGCALDNVTHPCPKPMPLINDETDIDENYDNDVMSDVVLSKRKRRLPTFDIMTMIVLYGDVDKLH